MNTSPQRIAPDFKPEHQIYVLAAKRGISVSFLDAEIDDFIYYWTKQKVRRKDWQGTFWNRIKALWSYKAQAEKKTSRTNPQANVEWEKPVIKVSKSRPSLKQLKRLAGGGIE